MIRSRTGWILSCGFGILIGVTFSLFYAGSKRPIGETASIAQSVSERNVVPARPSAVVLSPLSARLSDDDREALRTLIRDEIRAATTPAAVTDAGVPDLEALARELTPTSLDLYKNARSLVARAMNTKAWSSANREELRSALIGGQLPPELFDQIIRPLVVAVNRRAVHWEGEGPLF